MISVFDIVEILSAIAPPLLAEKWDNVGLLVGNEECKVTGIVAALDARCSVIDEAIKHDCNVVIVHHPVIFQPLKRIDTNTAEGRLLQKALANNISIIACHTNFDNAYKGVSHYLGEQLGLTDCQPLLPSKASEMCGTGCIGKYNTPILGEKFIQRLFSELSFPENSKSIQIAGTLPHEISCAALCGGSGGDFAKTARAMGAEVYVSAEIKHHIALWATENNFCIIDGSHYATEKPAVHLIIKHLAAAIKDRKKQEVGIPIFESLTENHPFKYITTKNKIEEKIP